MRAVFACCFALAACAPRAMPVGPTHPAHADAEAGRLAGPPPALRPGVAQPAAPTEPAKPGAHEHHGSDEHGGHEGHGPANREDDAR